MSLTSALRAVFSASVKVEESRLWVVGKDGVLDTREPLTGPKATFNWLPDVLVPQYLGSGTK